MGDDRRSLLSWRRDLKDAFLKKIMQGKGFEHLFTGKHHRKKTTLREGIDRLLTCKTYKMRGDCYSIALEVAL